MALWAFLLMAVNTQKSGKQENKQENKQGKPCLFLPLHRFINGPIDKAVDALAFALSVGLDLISFPLWDRYRDPVIMIFDVFGDAGLLLL